MNVVFKTVSSSWVTDKTTSAIRTQWIHGLAPQHAALPPGKHHVKEGDVDAIRVPPGIPVRWAQLEPFLSVRFRPYTPAEKKAAHGDRLGTSSL